MGAAIKSEDPCVTPQLLSEDLGPGRESVEFPLFLVGHRLSHGTVGVSWGSGRYKCAESTLVWGPACALWSCTYAVSDAPLPPLDRFLWVCLAWVLDGLGSSQFTMENSRCVVTSRNRRGIPSLPGPSSLPTALKKSISFSAANVMAWFQILGSPCIATFRLRHVAFFTKPAFPPPTPPTTVEQAMWQVGGLLSPQSGSAAASIPQVSVWTECWCLPWTPELKP